MDERLPEVYRFSYSVIYEENGKTMPLGKEREIYLCGSEGEVRKKFIKEILRKLKDNALKRYGDNVSVPEKIIISVREPEKMNKHLEGLF